MISPAPANVVDLVVSEMRCPATPVKPSSARWPGIEIVTGTAAPLGVMVPLTSENRCMRTVTGPPVAVGCTTSVYVPLRRNVSADPIRPGVEVYTPGTMRVPPGA